MYLILQENDRNQPKTSDSTAKKMRMRRRFRRRAGFEAIIGHLKTDHRLGKNYLHGEESPQINTWLAATGWNLKKWMEQWVREGKMAAFCMVVSYGQMPSPIHFEFLRSDYVNTIDAKCMPISINQFQ